LRVYLVVPFAPLAAALPATLMFFREMQKFVTAVRTPVEY